MGATLSTIAYLVAAVLFILTLRGLSHPETSRQGNLYGMIGMAIAVVATLLRPGVDPGGIGLIAAAARLLAQEGPNALTLRRVTSEAGTTPPTSGWAASFARSTWARGSCSRRTRRRRSRRGGRRGAKAWACGRRRGP